MKLTTQNNEAITSLNALKFICAIMVVGIHIDFVLRPYLVNLYRIAVPIFFMISGYFLPDKDLQLNSSRIKRQIFKIIKFTILANCAYILLFSILGHKLYFPILPSFIEGNTICGALWYMNAYIEALMIIWILHKLKIANMPVFAVLILLGLALNIWSGRGGELFNFPDDWKISYSGRYFNLSRNFFSIALPMVLTGMIIRWKREYLKHFDWLRLSLVALIFQIIEIIILWPVTDMSDILFATIPLSLCIFCMCLYSENNNMLIKIFARLGKCYSTKIYIYHFLIFEIMMIAVAQLPFSFFSNQSLHKYWIYPCLIFVMILVFGLYEIVKSKFYELRIAE